MPAKNTLQVNLILTVTQANAPTNSQGVPPDERESIVADAHDRVVQSMMASIIANADRPSPSLAGVRGRPY